MIRHNLRWYRCRGSTTKRSNGTKINQTEQICIYLDKSGKLFFKNGTLSRGEKKRERERTVARYRFYIKIFPFVCKYYDSARAGDTSMTTYTRVYSNICSWPYSQQTENSPRYNRRSRTVSARILC